MPKKSRKLCEEQGVEELGRHAIHGKTITKAGGKPGSLKLRQTLRQRIQKQQENWGNNIIRALEKKNDPNPMENTQQ